jgi:protein-S-isoprenylcysteine O-methyltransferase Ste14
MSILNRNFNVSMGNFFFRYRNALFPIAIITVVVFTRPIQWTNPIITNICLILGLVCIILGQLVRFFTIGFDYIDRGGKDKKVYASRLVQKGVYGITRNPMYIGNILILIGFCIAAGSFIAYVFIIPIFAYIYWAIICAEENYLRDKYKEEFIAYCNQVNRFIPSIKHIKSAISGFSFDWQRTIKQEIGTIFGVILGILFLLAWRMYFLSGIRKFLLETPEIISLILASIPFYLLVIVWKKKDKISFYSYSWFKFTRYSMIVLSLCLVIFCLYYEIKIEPLL